MPTGHAADRWTNKISRYTFRFWAEDEPVPVRLLTARMPDGTHDKVGGEKDLTNCLLAAGVRREKYRTVAVYRHRLCSNHGLLYVIEGTVARFELSWMCRP